jgi:threonine dehydratase
LQAREDTTRAIIEKTGATLIHPYDNFHVICGQGTATLELLQEKPDLDIIIAPVGGGGLMSGTSVCAKGSKRDILVYGAEPLNANDAFISFNSGILTKSATFAVIRKNVDQILTAKESSIIECMLLVWERMKIIIEPSSATVLAVVRENMGLFSGRKIGLIISGGNVDFRNLPF